MHTFAHKALRTLCAAAMAVALVPVFSVSALAEALASTGQTGSLTTGSWTLAYTIAGGEATITGYTAPASAADLVIPEKTPEGAKVTTIGEEAFKGCDKIRALSIADSVTRISYQAFYGTSATSVSLGTGAVVIGNYSFAYNASMTTFTFREGCHPEFFGHHAFAYCTALKELTIPALLGDAHKSEWNLSDTSGTITTPTYSRLGDCCFWGCTGLERITYLAGAKNGGEDYLLVNGTNTGYNIYGTPNSKLTIVSYLTNPYITGSGSQFNTSALTMYFAVYFYASKAAAEADTDLSKAGAIAVLKKGTYYKDICCEDVPQEQYLEGSAPVPHVSSYTSAGNMIWGFEIAETTSNSLAFTVDSSLSAVKKAYPVNRNDLTYAYLYSPESDSYQNNSGSTSTPDAFRPDNQFIRINGKGEVALDHIRAYSLDGQEIDRSLYTLRYFIFENGSNGNEGQLTAEVTPSQMVDGQQYRAYAYGVGEFANTRSVSLSFRVRRYDATLVDCTGGPSIADDTGAAVNAVTGSLSNPAFMVMAPASDWRTSLVATAYAAVGRGLCVYSDGTENGDETYYALVNAISMTDTVTFVGATSAIGTAAIARAKLLTESRGGTYNYFDSADPAALSLSIYDAVAKYGPKEDEPYAWGQAAVLVPWSDPTAGAAAAQLACALGAPVFFAAADGSVPAEVQQRLAAFTQVYAVGAGSGITAEAVAVLRASGLAVTEVATGSSALEASLACAQALGDELGESLAVGFGCEPAAVMAAAQYAQVTGGTALACSSAAEAKELQAWLAARDYDALGSICLVGSFASVDGQFSKRVYSVFETPMSTAPEQGDSFCVNGLVYQAAGGSATLVAASTGLSAVTVPASVEFGGSTYSVISIAAGAFAGSTALQGIQIGANVTAVPASAFSGCTALASVTGGAKVKSIGASAFNGCTSLSSFKLSSAKLTTVGASAFSGCTGLKSFTCSSPVLATVGSKAFMGCTKLATFKVTSKVLKKIGASAFSGCKKLTALKLTGTTKLTKAGVKNALKGSAVKTVSVPAAKVSAYAKLFTKANAGLKATVKKA
ncbi:MAG: leucine-rich repeat domain-containing protein [Coriobacteriales bacterium]